jgi:hypothetical protein
MVLVFADSKLIGNITPRVARETCTSGPFLKVVVCFNVVFSLVNFTEEQMLDTHIYMKTQCIKLKKVG